MLRIILVLAAILAGCQSEMEKNFFGRKLTPEEKIVWGELSFIEGEAISQIDFISTLQQVYCQENSKLGLLKDVDPQAKDLPKWTVTDSGQPGAVFLVNKTPIASAPIGGRVKVFYASAAECERGDRPKVEWSDSFTSVAYTFNGLIERRKYWETVKPIKALVKDIQ